MVSSAVAWEWDMSHPPGNSYTSPESKSWENPCLYVLLFLQCWCARGEAPFQNERVASLFVVEQELAQLSAISKTNRKLLKLRMNTADPVEQSLPHF